MGQKEGLIVNPSQIFPDEGIQSIECPNCHEVIPTGHTRDELDIATELFRDIPVICGHCHAAIFIQGESPL